MHVTSLKFSKKVFDGAVPLIELLMIVLASDFELPGLPMRKSGILKLMHTTIIITFSRSALL